MTTDTPQAIQENFKKVINDFMRDMHHSFPEYEAVLAPYLPVPTDAQYTELYAYCKTVYPARFFDILYKNEAMFSVDNDHPQNTQFLPGIEFKTIWNTGDISDTTKDALWKYFQLILFSVIHDVGDTESFGDTAKLFEAIDEGELKTKLEEVIEQMSGLFDGLQPAQSEAEAAEAAEAAADDSANNNNNTGSSIFDFFMGGGGGDGGGGSGGKKGKADFAKFAQAAMGAFAGDDDNADDGDGQDDDDNGGEAGKHKDKNKNKNKKGGASSGLPNPESIHRHLSSLLDGKIGSLAKEIAEETAKDMQLDMSSETSVKGVFQQLMSNPGKLTGLVKTVGDKLDSKLKSGELKESEIMQEASDLMNQMKKMPGMGNLASMMSQMGMNMPKGGKMNLGAMQSHLQRNIQSAKMRERMMKKMEQRAKQAPAAAPAPVPAVTGTVFSTGEKVERTPRFPPVHAQQLQPLPPADLDISDEEPVQPTSAKSNKNKKNKNKNKKK